jgi:hypothetical protein
VYQVRIESSPIDEEVAVAFSSDGRPGAFQLADGAIASGAVIEFDSDRRSLNFECTIEAASDARLAILLAGSEFDKHLEELGAAGVRILNAEARPHGERMPMTEAPADFVTAAEAARIVGVDALRFRTLSRSTGFPGVCGHIDVYSRTAVRRWAELHSDASGLAATG